MFNGSGLDLGLKQMIWHSQAGNQMEIPTYFNNKMLKSEQKILNRYEVLSKALTTTTTTDSSKLSSLRKLTKLTKINLANYHLSVLLLELAFANFVKTVWGLVFLQTLHWGTF